MTKKDVFQSVKRRTADHLVRVVCVVAVIVTSFAANGTSIGATTSGGVNWLDPSGYEKPEFVTITVPDETASAKYYVNMGGGSDSNNCTSATTPCNSMRGLAEKGIATLRGGGTAGAYVYVRGSGQWKMWGSTSDNFYGAPGKEIVVVPWPGYTATFTTSDQPTFGGGGAIVHDVIVDGGASMALRFTAKSSGDIAYCLDVNGYNLIFYRIQAYTASGNSNLFNVCSQLGPANCHDIKFVNSEFHDCTGPNGYQCSAVYLGGCTCGASSTCGGNNITIQNNVLRALGGEGLEINPRTLSDNIVITGNAIHNVGKQTCGGSWDCRPAITLDGPSCGTGTTNAYVMNNLIWDIGGAGIWTKTGYSSQYIYNNTIYDYSNGGSGNGVCMQGICSEESWQGVVENNIIYDPSGVNPFGGSGYTASNNLCGTGKSCGTNQKTWSANTALSTDETSANFLVIGDNSEAKAAGMTIGGVSAGYGGGSRPPYDIGAFVYGSSGLQPPANLRITP